MKKIGILLVSTALALSACGKRTDETAVAQSPTGYNAQGEPIGGTDTPGLGAAIGQEINVRVISSQPSLLTGDQATADITAAVTNASNLPMADMEITFSANGGVLQGAQTVTDENGEATAVLSLKYDSANQDILVKAVAGNFDGVARVVAEGSTLELSGDENVVPGNDVEIEAKLTAGDGSAIANEIVTISSANGNALSSTSALTDPQGVVSVTSGSVNGGDTITFMALVDALGNPSVSQAHKFSVSDDQLQFASDSKTEFGVNQAHEINVEWSYNGEPIAQKDLKFSITAGQILGDSVVTTNNAGVAKVSVLSTIAGEVTLYVSAPDGSVTNKHTFDFVGDTPALIKVNTTSSRVNIRDKASISAIITDANGNPVKNTTVVFSSSNLKGGQLSATSAVTNTKGIAEIVFTAGTAATEQGEIEIYAEVDGSDIFSSAELTIVEPVLNVTMGTAHEIFTTGAETQYYVNYVVQVADGGGQALKGAQVQLSIQPVSYTKGHLLLVDENGISRNDAEDKDTWKEDHWAKHRSTTLLCFGEDTNGNRILDAGEDTNNNGVLDPQDPALLAPVTEEGLATLEGNGTLTTDDTGSGYFRVQYPITNSRWASINVVARAQALGVEATTTLWNTLDYDVKEYPASNSNPANRVSPYGMQLDYNEYAADGITVTNTVSGCTLPY